MDSCSSNPCYNGGVCSNTPDGYQCECSAAWSGARCEISKATCDSKLSNGRNVTFFASIRSSLLLVRNDRNVSVPYNAECQAR